MGGPPGPQQGQFEDQIERDPNAKYPAAKGRYLLYVGLFCPFACRALILLHLKGLQDVIDVAVVHWFKGDPDENGNVPGWPFDETYPGCTRDPILNAKYLSELYFKAQPGYEGRYSVPVLWDKETGTIVNNESPQIMRMLSTAFDDFCPPERKGWTYAPADLMDQIETESKRMQDTVNSGVYKAGFASKQEDYERHIGPLFESLDHYEHLSSDGRPFLLGKRLTELDVRFYTTIIRFDTVYFSHFKCNKTRIRDGYPRITAWLARLYERMPAFHDTTNFDHIKKNYFVSHRHVNGSGVVPLGPKPHVMPVSSDDKVPWDNDAWRGTYEQK